ncbi:radical SAM domain-containing protein [Candidatus Magnetobacterium bavaricum]|uniref:Radical SAM domain-containing protein n=1 Tax=Candidatus Magnetobacterium bavaricum TaxID=29290 RepID=A0A0F3GPE8_9BACT|nr:radical SAM domain-containing protein [Candidatus Magnetobacterium bavaricum]
MRISGFDPYFYLQWHINSQCNLSCAHCYVQQRRPQLSEAELFLVLDKYIAFLNQKAIKGRIQFSGGEPFLSGALMPLLVQAGKHGLPTRVLSNGTVITAELASALPQTGCRTVQISLDGDRTMHNDLRGNNAFERALEGAINLRNNNITVTFMMTVSRRNHLSLKCVYDICRQYADRFSFSRLVPIGTGSQMSSDVLSIKETKRLFKAFFELKSDDGSPKSRISKPISRPMRDPLWHPYFKRCNPYLLNGCSIGYNGVCIDSDGTVYPCRRLPIPLGNILTEDLADIYNSEVLNQLRNRDLLKGKCGRCPLRWQCGGCRAIAYALTGDYLQQDPQCFR